MLLFNSLRAMLALSEMKRNQWKGRGELESLQDERLKALIAYAKKNVPYYRESLDGHDGAGLDGLESLPIVRKTDIQGREERMVSREFRTDRLAVSNTSGSSGIPLKVFFTTYDGVFSQVLRYHLYTEAGLGPMDVQAQLTFARRPMGLLNRLGFLKCHCLPFSEGDAATLESLRRIRPRALISNPVWLSSLASANLEKGAGLKVRNLFSTGEMLGPGARDIITGSFGGDLRNRYGAVESGSMAWECERGSMHLYSDSTVIEIVDGQGKPVREGAVGNVVVTPLWRHAMPFIRYELGDRAAMGGKCKCGRGLHVIKSLDGRSNGFLLLPSGRLFIASYVGGRLRTFPGIMQFQVVQERSGNLLVRIVPVEPGRPPERKQIAEAIGKLLSEPLAIEVEFVERIEREKSGKICEFISKARMEQEFTRGF